MEAEASHADLGAGTYILALAGLPAARLADVLVTGFGTGGAAAAAAPGAP